MDARDEAMSVNDDSQERITVAGLACGGQSMANKELKKILDVFDSGVQEEEEKKAPNSPSASLAPSKQPNQRRGTVIRFKEPLQSGRRPQR